MREAKVMLSADVQIWGAQLILAIVSNHFLFLKNFFYLKILSRNKFLISLISLKICFKAIRAVKAFEKILGFPDGYGHESN